MILPLPLGAELAAWVVLATLRGRPLTTAKLADATPDEAKVIRDADSVVRARAAQPP